MTKPLVLKANRRRNEMVSSHDRMPALMLWVPSICNQDCIYCATEGWKPDTNPLNHEQIINVVDQAAELNVKQININGNGEPTRYQKLTELLNHIHEYGIDCRISTNGTAITEKLAENLYKNENSLVIKLHSKDNHTVHNRLVGKKDSHELVMQSMNNLIDAGFPNIEECGEYRYTQIGIMTLLANPCYGEIEGILKYCNEKQFYPMIDDIVVAGNTTREKYIYWALDEDKKQIISKKYEEIMGYPATTDTLDICTVDTGGIFIGKDGEYYSDRNGSCCDALAEGGFGSVREKKLKDFWEELLEIKDSNKEKFDSGFRDYRNSCAGCNFTCYGMWKSQKNAGVR